MFVPLPVPLLIVPITLLLLALQIWGSYRLITRIFRWLTLALFAYVSGCYRARFYPVSLSPAQG